MATEHPDIFRALAAPFQKEQERSRNQGGMTLTYITARAVMNRLDEVIGPENWWNRYEETKDGIKCAITLRLPDGREVTKEDGGGFATAMKAEDDVEKSGYSDALKRAGVAWGIGRYLYKDGVPKYQAKASDPPPPAPPAARPAPYREWLKQFCDEVNAKWVDQLRGFGSAPAELVSPFQLNRHLLKFVGIPPTPKDEAANFQAGVGEWEINSEVMAAEAKVYCRKLWKDGSAKLKTKPREPGGDDNMPSPEEEAIYDRMSAGKAGANA